MQQVSSRNPMVDIAKGLLILLVVVGHTSGLNNDVSRYILWFHMPCFFIISGLFMKTDGTLRNEVRKKVLRIVVPYACFSILLGTVMHRGQVPQTILATLYGGWAIQNAYTYPYYFLTVLFIASLMVFALRKYTRRPWLWIIVAYVAIHLLVTRFTLAQLIWVPWDADMALFVAAYLMIGNQWRTFFLKNLYGGVCLVLLCALYALDIMGVVHYQFSLNKFVWHIGLDIVIPVIALQAVFFISAWMAKVPAVCRALCYVGRASLCIMLLHPALLQASYALFQGHDVNIMVHPMVASLASIAAYWLLTRQRITRMMLGEKK
jgi:fucose 4-O-acetylase-like acetyltransferase